MWSRRRIRSAILSQLRPLALHCLYVIDQVLVSFGITVNHEFDFILRFYWLWKSNQTYC